MATGIIVVTLIVLLTAGITTATIMAEALYLLLEELQALVLA
jgi:hypothetical protein